MPTALCRLENVVAGMSEPGVFETVPRRKSVAVDVGGVTMGKSDLVGFVGNDMVRGEHERVLYENDEVGVMHSIAHFANGSASEAVLSFARFKDGKIVRMETGATPLSEDYTLVGQDD